MDKNFSLLPTDIRRTRKLKGLTQKQLGEKLGLAEITISSYERGTREPNRATLKMLGHILKDDHNYFFYE